jgi:hypothetical protein
MLARRIRNSLAVIGALLPFATFAEGQPRKTVAVGNTEGRQNMSIEQHAQGTAAATVRTSEATARVAPRATLVCFCRCRLLSPAE